MKKIGLSILFCLLFPLGLLAQQQTEYNQKGDEAMKRKAYQDAKIWYEEGVAYCDAYSIDKLTEIWLKNVRMRPSMRSLMNKCLNCLNIRGTEQDTTAMRQLIVYYRHGIGTPASTDLAEYWSDKLEQTRRLVEYAQTSDATLPIDELQTSRQRMKFFIGYNYAVEAPYGLTIGAVGKRLGWSVRFKTNMSFDKHIAECNDQNGGELIDASANEIYYFTGEKKKNSYSLTAGMVVKCTDWLYTSVGVGYGDRTLLYEYNMVNPVTAETQQTGWAKHIDTSYKGVAADWDVMFKLGPIYLSTGCSTVNFKYIDFNAGVGVFF